MEYLKFRIREGVAKYPKAPLEEEFAEWLKRMGRERWGNPLAERTIETHIENLRRDIAQMSLYAYLTSIIGKGSRGVTQRYYKEFLCEHFSHIILPLLQDYAKQEGVRVGENRKTQTTEDEL